MRLLRFINTIKYLKPIQFFYRVKNKFALFLYHGYKKYKGIENLPFRSYIQQIHSENKYLTRFSLAEDKVYLLNEEVELDFKRISNYSPLIQLNLQYFEYAIVWAQKGVPFSFLKEKWNEYINSNIRLNPYAVSMQIPNMIIAMEIYGVVDAEIVDELFSRYKWLLKNQEKHLLANHYFENLKAIVLSSYYFQENNIFIKYVRKLQKECYIEILKDGVHFELSPMYHKIILEDLLLIRKICNFSWLNDSIQNMLTAMDCLERGFNRIPLFNDSGDNVSKSASSLIEACKAVCDIYPSFRNKLENAGYYKIENNKVSMLVDSGPVGPDYNPGHAHCDCLSFELFLENKPLFVNCGTYQYQGDKRHLFRSTSSHNTVMIGNNEQSQVWGEHRVGKRISKISGCLNTDGFVGQYLSANKDKHIRRIILSGDSFKVLDTVLSKQQSQIKSFLHLAPGYSYAEGFVRGNGNRIRIEPLNSKLDVAESFYSDEFGKIEKIQCLVFKWLTDNLEHGYIVHLQ